MPFKMILDNAEESERPLVRSFLKHIIIGFGSGFLLGAVSYFLILIRLRDQSIEIPAIYGIAACFPLAALGGLISTGIFMSSVIDRESSNTREARERADDHHLRDRPAQRH
ncbi:MAG: hypothetical protein AAF950_07410 [Pseudomonadota bacterium]